MERIIEARKFITDVEKFLSVPGNPIAYWISDTMVTAFKQWEPLERKTACAAGVSSGDNEKYLRLWFEIPYSLISFSSQSEEDFQRSCFMYAPCNKGGIFRKWYGNNEYVALWKKEKEFHRNGSTYKELLFREGMTWSAITTYRFNSRYYNSGYIFDHASPSLFTKNKTKLVYYISLTNSCVGQFVMNLINPTINTGADSLRKFPIQTDDYRNNGIDEAGRECIELSQKDWDSFETSWDFKKHPLI